MKCPHCQHNDSSVVDTNKEAQGGIRRRRECLNCGQRFSTIERPILTTPPLIIKRDGTRETFDREKLLAGLRKASSKRPVTATMIENSLTKLKLNFKNGVAPKSTRVLSAILL